MITQEIKLYEEPIATNNTVAFFQGIFTQKDIDEEVETAKTLNIKVGQFYRYKASGVIYQITRFETDPKKVSSVYNSPAIFKCKRSSEVHLDKETPFAAEELMGVHMEYLGHE